MNPESMIQTNKNANIWEFMLFYSSSIMQKPLWNFFLSPRLSNIPATADNEIDYNKIVKVTNFE